MNTEKETASQAQPPFSICKEAHGSSAISKSRDTLGASAIGQSRDILGASAIGKSRDTLGASAAVKSEDVFGASAVRSRSRVASRKTTAHDLHRPVCRRTSRRRRKQTFEFWLGIFLAVFIITVFAIVSSLVSVNTLPDGRVRIALFGQVWQGHIWIFEDIHWFFVDLFRGISDTIGG